MHIDKPISRFTNDTAVITTLDNVFDGLGFVGGGLLSLCLLPQIVKTCRTRSAKDISFVWQGISIAGLSLTFAYGVYFGLLPVFIPIIVEFSLMTILVVSKIMFDYPMKR